MRLPGTRRSHAGLGAITEDLAVVLCQTNNSRNSRQSLFSGIGVKAVAEPDQNTQALFRGHRRVVACIGLIGVLEARKYPGRFLHRS